MPDPTDQFEQKIDDTDLIAAWKSDPSTARVARLFGAHKSTIRRRLAKLRKDGRLPAADADPEREGKIAQLGASVPTEVQGAKLRELSVNLWGVAAKNADGELVAQGLDGIRAKYSFDQSVPEFPLIQPANPSTFAYYSAPSILRKIRREVVISDAQIGFLRVDGKMIPTHDPDAIDVAMQIVHSFQPHGLSWIGDWVDLPMFSRWPKKPEHVETTQASIQAGHDLAGELIAAAGPQCTERRFVLGNHDDRFAIWAREHNLEAMNLKRASDTAGWPVFSTPFLLRFDELGIHCTRPYPSGEAWLTSDLVLMHAPPKKLEMAASVIHGHTHKLTRETWAQTTHERRMTYFRYDCGCLCKVDGSVPSDRARTDWGQGFVVVEIIDGKIPKHSVEMVSIDPELTLFRGQEFRSALLAEAAA